MAAAKHEKRDVAIAYKAIALHRNLTSDAKSIGAALIDHFNQKTGQCDPSIDRLKALCGISEKGVRRSTIALCEIGLFRKSSHGGKSGRASYFPDWSAIRAVVADWQRRMKTGDGPDDEGGNRSEMTGTEDDEERSFLTGAAAPDDEGEPVISVPTTGQNCPVVPVRNDRQTNIPNQTYNQLGANDRSEGDAARDNPSQKSGQKLHGLLKMQSVVPKAPGYETNERLAPKGCSKSEAAWLAATRRLDTAIAATSAGWRSDMWVLTDETDRNAAITAELYRRGEGIIKLDVALRRARLQQGGDAHAQ